MRRLIATVAALLSLTSVCFAAFAIFQTAAAPVVPQIFYNIVTDGGAVCNDNHVVVTRTTSLASGSPNLSVTEDTFTSADVGKAIFIPGASGGGGVLRTTILSFTNPQNITLVSNGVVTLSGVSTALTYGNDDAPNFKTFNTWARDNQGSDKQVVLTIPSGRNCWFGTGQVISGTTIGNAWASGINNLIVDGAGATINSIDGSGFQLGTSGVCQAGLAQANGCSARIETVSTGSTQITLTAASLAAGYISRFPVDRWIMLGGVDTQGLWNAPYGFPPNATVFEWRKVIAADGGTGVITLDRPLTYTYLSTWPNFNSGNAFEADQGGPATIWAVGGASNSWNASFEYRGLTITQDSQTYAQGRNVTYRNVIFTGAHGGIPTQNETWSVYNTDMSGMHMETDKLVGTMLMDGVTIFRITSQSSSTHSFIMRNSTVTGSLVGTATQNDITDSTLAMFRPGASAYGAVTGTTVCTRCAVADFQHNGTLLQDRPTDYSMSSGVISFANTNAGGPDPDQRVFVPGGNVYWSANGYATTGLFQAQAITQDATNVYIQTNEAGGFPTIGTGYPRFFPHPAPQWTCDACTGDPEIVATNIQRGATPLAPLGEYASLDYAPTSAQGDLQTLPGRGRLVSLTINVTQAYTGSGAAVYNPTGRFHQFTVKQSDWTQFDWVPQINLKVAGERIITPSGTTCNGAPGPCSGDTCVEPNCFTLPEAVWIQSSIGGYMGSTFSGGVAPTFTMTLRTDQGVVP